MDGLSSANAQESKKTAAMIAAVACDFIAPPLSPVLSTDLDNICALDTACHSPPLPLGVPAPSISKPKRESPSAAEIFVTPKAAPRTQRLAPSAQPTPAAPAAPPVAAVTPEPETPSAAAPAPVPVPVPAHCKTATSGLDVAVAEQRFLALAARCELAVLMLGPDNDVRYANAAAQKLFASCGYAREGAVFPLALARSSSAVHELAISPHESLHLHADVVGTWWKDHPVWMACLRSLARPPVPKARTDDISSPQTVLQLLQRLLETCGASEAPAPAAQLQALCEDVRELEMAHAQKHTRMPLSQRLELSCFTTAALVGDARRQADMMLGAHAAHAAHVRLHIAALPTLMLCADQGRLARALGHILANAMRHAKNCVTLRLLCVQDQGLDIHIEDDGAGFGVEGLARAFALHSSARPCVPDVVPQGLGIGLTYARAILLRHDGALDILSPPHASGHVRAHLPVHCLLTRAPASRRALASLSTDGPAQGNAFSRKP